MRPEGRATSPVGSVRDGSHEMGVSPVVPISAIEHHEYCARQCALIHVEGQWVENVHTVQGTRAHRRVDHAPSRHERGRLVLRAIPLWSEVLGLSGRADAVEIHAAGVILPVEHKSGTRHGRTADLQVCAQAMCLEEMLGTSIPEAAIWYGGPRRRHRVRLDESLRTTTWRTIESIRASITSGELPDAPADERCRECQLAPRCLPELTAAPGRIALYDDRVLGCAT